MQTIKQINTILEEIFSLKLVAHAYTEISTIKLQKIRAGIERNRTFFQEITQVYRMVKVAAGMQNLTSGNPKKGAVSILLTSNQRFYGGLELPTSLPTVLSLVQLPKGNCRKLHPFL